MAGLSGYEIFTMVSQGAGPAGLVQAADVTRAASTRLQGVGDQLRRTTTDMRAAWRGAASDGAARATQPIEQALQREQETLGQVDAALRAQAQSYERLRAQVLPMATPQPPELTLFDQLTPWDTDNEITRREWFEADANNRRVYAEYVAATGQNQAMLPQAAQAAGAQGGNTAVQSAGGAGAKSASSAPPQVAGAGAGGTTAPSSAGAGGGSASAPSGGGMPSGGGRTSASEAEGAAGGRTPVLPGPGTPKQPSDRTATADASLSALGGVPIAPRPASGRDTAHTSNLPKGDHLGGGGGVAPVLPGGIGTGDPTGTRGGRGPLGAGERSGVLGKTLPPGAPGGAFTSAPGGKPAMAGVGGGFAPHAGYARDEEERVHKRTVYLDEDTDALVGRLPGSVTPVIGED
ncbi:WXG100 family type VII secretion target [Saccharothrix sp.]|uniref:WXG100 family type VII secretion target n=1 Tax=Saccharothrix sp. TaxID=1873460 RepID=UPI002810AEE7|nr:WXG100 family type VII secretion target [Saccharothrix sp.]